MFILFWGFTSVYSYTGEAGPPMLKMVYGSRALSLGGAFVGLADDMFYIDSNPAGGDVRDIFKVCLLHQEWIADVNYEAIRLARGFKDKFFLGLGFTYLYRPFTYYDYYGESSGKTYNISQSLGLLNFGYSIKKINISVGANLKFFYNHIPEELYPGQSYFLLVSDVGIISRTDILKRFTGDEPGLSFGAALKNIGFSKEVEKLPTEVHAGVSCMVLKNLLFTAELAVPFYEPVYGSIGAEFDFDKKFFMQGGVQIKRNPMFSLGFGYKRNDLTLNVSYTPTIYFYNMMSASITYSFGETRLMEKKQEIDELMMKAVEYYRNSEYDKTLEMLESVLEIDPGNKKAIQLKESTITLKKVKSLKESR